jgi:hypothetical protein
LQANGFVLEWISTTVGGIYISSLIADMRITELPRMNSPLASLYYPCSNISFLLVPTKYYKTFFLMISYNEFESLQLKL